jgi:hypothetical protein
MSQAESAARSRTGTIFVVGLSVGLVIGLSVGSVIALRLGSEAIHTVRSLIDRMSGRGNQVHFELLLQ